ncbi:MAG: RidA family protein [Verrucomicrobiae bacterium]|nr:RidA family protein [Verrucomicrobiae bacterium]
MTKTIIATDLAPKAVGPYSQAVRTGDLLFMAGQIPLDPQTGEVVGTDIKTQTTRVLENIRGVLSSQGLTTQNVVKCTVFLTDLGHFAAMNEVYASYFNSNPPARTTIQISKLPKAALIEIEAIAHY